MIDVRDEGAEEPDVRPLFGQKRASVGLGVAVLAAIVALVGASLGLSFQAGRSDYRVNIHFPTGNGIIAGSDVFFGGVKVGSVYDLKVDDDAHGLLLTASIDGKYAPVHEGATAAIRPKSLLGEKYLAMTVGDPSKDAVPDGATLPESATSVNVELDQLINIFDEPTRKQLRILIDNLGKGLFGQGRSTNETFQAGARDLGDLAQVTDILQQRDAELRRIIESLTKLTATLSSDQQRQTYIDLIKHGDAVLKTLKAEDADVQQGIERMNHLFGEFDQGLQGRAADLQGIFSDLPSTVADLDALSQNLGAKGDIVYPLVLTSAPGVVSSPVLFGSQPSHGATTFTSNLFTRVMPAQGCLAVNNRTLDSKGFAQEGGTPIRYIPTAPAFQPNCNQSAAQYCTDHPSECAAALLASLCGLDPALCPHGAGAPLIQGQTGGAGRGAAATPASRALARSSGRAVDQDATDSLLRYLLQ